MRWLKNNKGNIGSLFGSSKKDNPFSAIKLPDFQVDPSFTKSQDTLSNLGENILSGNLPDYYKPIGDFNSDSFKQLISNVSGQINQSAQENAAISGTGRSGTAQAAASGALSNVIPQLQYSDYTRALQGRGALLNTGIGVESGVREAGQNQESLLNSFNLNRTGLALKQAGLANDFDQNAAKEQGAGISSLFNIGAGALGGFVTGGPMGAVMGGLGALSGGGGSSGIGSLLSALGGIGGGAGGTLSLAKDQSLGAFGGAAGSFDSPAQSFFKNFKL